MSTAKKPSKRPTTRRRTATTAAPAKTAKPSPTPAATKPAFACDVFWNPEWGSVVATRDGARVRGASRDHVPAVELGEEFMRSIFVPSWRGRMTQALWDVILATVWGETDTGVLDMYENRIGGEMSREEAHELLDGARQVSSRLARICDVGEMILEHGAKAVMKVPPARPEQSPAATLRALPDVFADLNDILCYYDRTEAEAKAYNEVIHALTWARARDASGHALNNLVGCLGTFVHQRTEDFERAHAGLPQDEKHPFSVYQYELTARLASLLGELARHLADGTKRHAVMIGDYKSCNLDWKVAAG